jgi:hypothetical protein
MSYGTLTSRRTDDRIARVWTGSDAERFFTGRSSGRPAGRKRSKTAVVRYSVYDAACFLGAVDTSDSAVAATFVPTAQHQRCGTDAAGTAGCSNSGIAAGFFSAASGASVLDETSGGTCASHLAHRSVLCKNL